ncbi:hypothetical protein B4144_1121 [Bacillus atrophaeus]|nr:hypothetical protein B4144_1121 [Bacillus atrophaeus]
MNLFLRAIHFSYERTSPENRLAEHNGVTQGILRENAEDG